MNKEQYDKARLEIIEFTQEDVIVTSGGSGNETEDDVFG